MVTDNRTKNDRGVVMVELALILPLLLVLVLGIVEFGRAYNAKTMLQASAREGARELALRHGGDKVEDAVLEVLGEEVLGEEPSDFGLTSTACPATSDPDSNDKATVTVTRKFTFVPSFGNVISLLPGGGGDFGTIDMSATAVMRCGL